MTYCLAIHLDDGLILASDSRTNAGVDHISTYSKMNVFQMPGRIFILLSSGNLATTQEVLNRVQRDIDDHESKISLANVKHIMDAAKYIGKLSLKAQQEHSEALDKHGINAECCFILGGQIEGGKHDAFLIYPQGNCITASPTTPYLQIGEIKYGKPILDRILTAETDLGDAARCALVSLDSTMRSNISVGPPVELAVYKRDTLQLDRRLILELDSPEYLAIREAWSSGLQRAFDELPRFDWED